MARVLGLCLATLLALTPAYVFAEDEIAPRSPEEDRYITVYRETNESVVFITTTTNTIDPFEVVPRVRPEEGTGSGIVVDGPKGIILTNYHVIQSADKIQITLGNGRSYAARLVGLDPADDLAVLQIRNPPEELKAIPFANSSKLEVGQKVLAIGNPFGLNRTLTVGIVSSLNRTIKSPTGRLMKGLIQTDAAINPGNSGGALLDMAGRLIGVNSAILSQSGDSAGIGFAVPINLIRKVLPELVATGKVSRPELGWVLVDTSQGPMVYRVFPETPAAQAGIQPILRRVDSVFVQGFVRDFERADLIYSINGKRVASKEEVEDFVESSTAREPVVIVLKRGGSAGPEREVRLKPEFR